MPDLSGFFRQVAGLGPWGEQQRRAQQVRDQEQARQQALAFDQFNALIDQQAAPLLQPSQEAAAFDQFNQQMDAQEAQRQQAQQAERAAQQVQAQREAQAQALEQRAAADLAAVEIDARAPQQPQAQDGWPQTETSRLFPAQATPKPLPDVAPQAPQLPQANQQQGADQQQNGDLGTHAAADSTTALPDFARLQEITASAPGEEFRQAQTRRVASGIRDLAAAAEQSSLPGPLKGAARAALPRAASVVERAAETIDPKEGALLGLEAAGLPAAAVAGAVGLPDRPLVPGVQPDTFILGGLTNPTEMAYGWVGPAELLGAGRAAGQVAQGAGRAVRAAGEAVQEGAEALGQAAAREYAPAAAAGITPTPGGSTNLADIARDVTRPARAAVTGAEQAADIAGGVAGGVTGAATGPEDQTPQERLGRGLVGAALGARAGPALRSLRAVGAGTAEELGARAGARRPPQQAAPPSPPAQPARGTPAWERVAGQRVREADRLAGRANQVRERIEQQASAWDSAQERIAQLEAQVEMAGLDDVVERPSWARARGGERAWTRADLEAIIERSDLPPDTIYQANWGDQIDPETIRLYQREVVSRRTGTAQVGQTATEEAASARKLRAELRAAQRAAAKMDRDMDRMLLEVGDLDERYQRAAAEVGKAVEAGEAATPLAQFEEAVRGLQAARGRVAELRAARRLLQGRTTPPAAGEAAQARVLAEGVQPITATPEQEVARLRLDKFPEWARPTIQQAAEQVGYAHGQRRGVVSDATAEAMADVSTRTFEQWVRRGAKAGTAYNTEELRALRNAVTAQAGTLNDLTRQYAAAGAKGEGTDALLARVLTEGEKLQALVTVAEGARAEWGRAGRAFQASTRRAALPPSEAIAHLFTKLGGRDNALKAVEEYQRLLDSGAHPIQLAQYWARVEQPPPGFTDWFTALRYNAMLSGPRTFEVNLIGNTLEVPWRLLRDAGASVARGRPEELLPEVQGLWLGLERGAAAFLETVAHGITEEQALRGDLPRDLSSRLRNPAAKTTATILEFPSRALQATDEVARQAAFGMAKGRMAAVTASKTGKRGQAWREEVARLLAADDPALLREATGIADRMTYKGELGGLGSALEAMARHPRARVAGNLLLPFLRTVYHITARGIDRSPLGIVGTAFDVATGTYAKGKELPKGVVPLGERLGDNVLGGLIGAWFINQGLQGNISAAGPDDSHARGVLRAQGWQPYSIRFGDKWVSYTNWGPAAIALSLAGSVGEAFQYQRAEEMVGDAVLDVLQRFVQLGTEQTYLQSIGAIYRGLSEPDRYGEQFVTGVLSSLVPYGALVNTAAQSGDPVARRPERGDIPGAVASRLPGMRQQQPVARDVFGGEVPNQYAGASAFLPWRIAPPPNPETADLRRYQGSESAAQDAQIARALERVTAWRNRPQEFPRPTDDELALWRRFGSRENPRYQRLRSQAQAQERRDQMARRAG